MGENISPYYEGKLNKMWNLVRLSEFIHNEFFGMFRNREDELEINIQKLFIERLKAIIDEMALTARG